MRTCIIYTYISITTEHYCIKARCYKELFLFLIFLQIYRHMVETISVHANVVPSAILYRLYEEYLSLTKDTFGLTVY